MKACVFFFCYPSRLKFKALFQIINSVCVCVRVRARARAFVHACALSRFSLCVRPWDDVLLVSVLKGQNVSGVRKDKGKKDVLIEEISVVLLRTEVLQRQHRYIMDVHFL